MRKSHTKPAAVHLTQVRVATVKETEHSTSWGRHRESGTLQGLVWTSTAMMGMSIVIPPQLEKELPYSPASPPLVIRSLIPQSTEIFVHPWVGCAMSNNRERQRAKGSLWRWAPEKKKKTKQGAYPWWTFKGHRGKGDKLSRTGCGRQQGPWWRNTLWWHLYKEVKMKPILTLFH